MEVKTKTLGSFLKEKPNTDLSMRDRLKSILVQYGGKELGNYEVNGFLMVSQTQGMRSGPGIYAVFLQVESQDFDVFLVRKKRQTNKSASIVPGPDFTMNGLSDPESEDVRNLVRRLVSELGDACLYLHRPGILFLTGIDGNQVMVEINIIAEHDGSILLVKAGLDYHWANEM